MKLYMYDARIEPGDEGGEVVTFPDVPEAVTEGNDRGEALSMAADALGVALLTYARQGRALPERRVRGRGLVPVAIEPDVAAKLAVMEAFSRARITKTELAARLGKDEREVRRILDPKHPTKLPALQAALTALGRRLIVGVEEAA
ncbi:MAG TPA: type II toxin-antitoxin system HicB family antitoxin [Beijerinckiaceae bacterium]|jgi:antitoxin HicB|nr:type II toxin-antitoxin system HicB family antitoxin [Beijerinckiaceae bacterium]